MTTPATGTRCIYGGPQIDSVRANPQRSPNGAPWQSQSPVLIEPGCLVVIESMLELGLAVVRIVRAPGAAKAGASVVIPLDALTLASDAR